VGIFEVNLFYTIGPLGIQIWIPGFINAAVASMGIQGCGLRQITVLAGAIDELDLRDFPLDVWTIIRQCPILSPVPDDYVAHNKSPSWLKLRQFALRRFSVFHRVSCPKTWPDF